MKKSNYQAILFCNGGMSSSMIAAKLNELGEKYHLRFKEGAFGQEPTATLMSKYDLVLVAPQLKAASEEYEDLFEEYDFPFIQIEAKEYTVNSEGLHQLFNRILTKLKLKDE